MTSPFAKIQYFFILSFFILFSCDESSQVALEVQPSSDKIENVFKLFNDVLYDDDDVLCVCNNANYQISVCDNAFCDCDFSYVWYDDEVYV